MPGVIKLIEIKKRGRPIKPMAFYFTHNEMRNIIKYWQDLYKEQFENYYVHAIPKLKDERHFTKPRSLFWRNLG